MTFAEKTRQALVAALRKLGEGTGPYSNVWDQLASDEKLRDETRAFVKKTLEEMLEEGLIDTPKIEVDHVSVDPISGQITATFKANSLFLYNFDMSDDEAA